MKFTRYFSTVFVGCFLMAMTAVHAQKAQIVFEKLTHDYGTFKESDGVQTAVFSFINKGTEPLILNNVRASCGCTTPKWTREPVGPGGRGEIEVSYDPKNRPGAFNKTVMVSSNAQNSTTVLRITGTVTEREKSLAELYPRQIGSLRAKNNFISFARMKDKEVKSQTLELVNVNDGPVKVGFRTVPDHLTVRVEPETIAPQGKGLLTVTFDASKADTYGFFSKHIYLSLDGSNDYRSSIGVSATIEEDFSSLSPAQLANAPIAVFPESTFDFGDIKQGQKVEHTFSLKNDGKSELIIRNIRASCGCTAVAPSQKVIAPGTAAPIQVTFDSRGKRGRQTNSVTIITNDPKVPTTILRMTGNVSTE
jgi:hypothetical protein